MKKIFTLCVAFVAAIALQAQSDFPVQFADKDGNIIADGTVITLSEAEDDGFGTIMMPTNLYVKNITDQEVQVGGIYIIQSMSNGVFQTCFPMNCVQKKDEGRYQTESGPLSGGQLKNMMTEWLPQAEGTAEVSYQLMTFKKNVITNGWNKDKYGPTVTLKFSYGVTGIADSKHEPAADRCVYDLQGRRLQGPVFNFQSTMSKKGLVVRDKKIVIVR